MVTIRPSGDLIRMQALTACDGEAGDIPAFCGDIHGSILGCNVSKLANLLLKRDLSTQRTYQHGGSTYIYPGKYIIEHQRYRLV